MGVKVKIGKGEVNRIGWTNYFSGRLEAQCDKARLDMTLRQIAEALAKQGNLQHGHIFLDTISFQIVRRGHKEQKRQRF